MPKLITKPFAQDGLRNPITDNTPIEPQNATYTDGFPAITQLPIESGGIAPERADFNGVFYDITDNLVFLTQGNNYGYNSGIQYPLNARIARADGVIVKNTLANNTNDPNSVMAGWEIDRLTPSQNLSDVPDKATARTNLDVYSKAETQALVAVVPDATETIAGKAKIATTAIAQAGTNDTDILTPKKLRDALNATGIAPVLALRAFVVFDGITGTIKKSQNISSVTRTGVGSYTIVMSVAAPDINYGFFGACQQLGTDGDIGVNGMKDEPKTTTTFKVRTVISVNSNTFWDCPNVYIGVFY